MLDIKRIRENFDEVADGLSRRGAEIALAETENAVCLRNGGAAFDGKIADLYARPASEELANFLGPANWLTPADARLWLRAEWPEARCVRPERLLLAPAQDVAATVVSSRFLGAFAETELRNTDGTLRMFIHRPPGQLPHGMRVHIHLADDFT